MSLFNKINLFIKLATMSVADAAHLLHVSPQASKEEITKAYKKMVLENHPDVNPSPEALDIIKLVNEAKSILDKHIELQAPKTTGKKSETEGHEISQEPYARQEPTQVPVKNMPKSIQKALKQLGHNRRTVGLIISPNSKLSRRSYYDSMRGYVATVNLKTGSFDVEYGDWGGPSFTTSRVDTDENIYTVPDDMAFILGLEGDKPTATVVLSPAHSAVFGGPQGPTLR